MNPPFQQRRRPIVREEQRLPPVRLRRARGYDGKTQRNAERSERRTQPNAEHGGTQDPERRLNAERS